MTVAILSGKGGTGKTFLSVNLAAAAEQAVYIDCDVEEPNGRLFLRPQAVEQQAVTTPLPAFDGARCDGCRRCVDFCRFHALVYVKGKPMVFPDVCHACGGCALVCPQGAVREEARTVGAVETGVRDGIQVVTGILNTGEASAVPVIRAALAAGLGQEDTTIIDCPPGSSCSVMESVEKADYCVLVTEPTAFGLHNLRMVQELVTLLGKPWGVVLNKAEGDYPPLEQFLRETGGAILASIPFSPELAALGAGGELACRRSPEFKALLQGLLTRLREECGA